MTFIFIILGAVLLCNSSKAQIEEAECNEPPLHTAVRERHVDWVRQLIRNGSDLYVAGCDGETAMQVALDTLDERMVLVLLENQFDLNKKLPGGWTAFARALVKNPEQVPMLEKYGGRVDARAPPDGRTNLHRAAEIGDVRMAALLLDHGASVNAVDGRNMTPLSLAVVKNKPAMVNLLFAAGAQLGVAPLHSAVVSGSPDALRALLQLGVRVDSKDADGLSAIWKAVELDDLEAAVLLRDFGANLQDVCCGTERPLLGWAAWNGSVRCIKWLVKNGVSVNVSNNGGWTPLHYAVDENHLHAVKTLVGMGACLTCKLSNGQTPLRLAMNKGHSDIVQYLKSSGALAS